MKIVSIRDAKKRLTELAREVEGGETIVVTRNGRPVFDLVPHQKRGGLNLEAGQAYLRSKGITTKPRTSQVTMTASHQGPRDPE